jgi:catechol 2,3-dioxygenase-like lactoylglutathione lyase family enzyme
VAPVLKGIAESCLNVVDVHRGQQFYQSVLGLEVLESNDRLCALRVDGQVLLLFQRGGSANAVETAGGVIPAHDTEGAGHVAFAIDRKDLDAWRVQLRDAGVEIESEVSWERGGASIYFRDLDDNLIELATPGVWPE